MTMLNNVLKLEIYAESTKGFHLCVLKTKPCLYRAFSHFKQSNFNDN